jgi:hypothetical protein
MAQIALRRLHPAFDLGKQGGLDPDATVRDFLGIGLRFPEQRLEPRLQILGWCAVKAVVDLARLDQFSAPRAC